MYKKIAIAALTAVCSLGVSAKTLVINGTQIEIGDIIANGSGCPAGSVTATATEDNKQVAILFSKYKALTTSEVEVAISDCNLAIPISVPAGFSVGIVGIDWRGSVYTSVSAFANFHREYFFSGRQGPSLDDNFPGTGFQNFVIEDDPAFVHYSACDGSPLIARADTSATVIGQNSFFSLRSADVEAKLLFNLNIYQC